VTWQVAGTDQAPINVRFVDIVLSTDGGQTFPTVLVQNVPNDGQHTVALPSVNTSTARFMVRSVGNVFFAISPTNFPIVTNQGTFVIAGVPNLPARTDDLPAATKQLLSKVRLDGVLQVKRTDPADMVEQGLQEAETRPTFVLVDQQRVPELLDKLQVPESARRAAEREPLLIVTRTATGTVAQALGQPGSAVRRAHAVTPDGLESASPKTPAPRMSSDERERILRKLDELEQELRALRRRVEGTQR
jgi:hypothetical protein